MFTSSRHPRLYLNAKPRYPRLPSAAPSSETKGDAIRQLIFFSLSHMYSSVSYVPFPPPFVAGLGGYGFLNFVPLVHPR